MNYSELQKELQRASNEVNSWSDEKKASIVLKVPKKQEPISELEVAEKELEKAQKKFVDTEHSLTTAHNDFLKSCQELEKAEENVKKLKGN